MSKQVPSINQVDELTKDAVPLTSGSSGDDDSVLGSSPADDLGDLNDDDPNAGGVMDIDKAREAMGETSDGDGEFRPELTDDNLNLNNNSELSSVDPTDPDELDEAP